MLPSYACDHCANGRFVELLSDGVNDRVFQGTYEGKCTGDSRHGMGDVDVEHVKHISWMNVRVDDALMAISGDS
jgi:hypothetical protein